MTVGPCLPHGPIQLSLAGKGETFGNRNRKSTNICEIQVFSSLSPRVSGSRGGNTPGAAYTYYCVIAVILLARVRNTRRGEATNPRRPLFSTRAESGMLECTSTTPHFTGFGIHRTHAASSSRKLDLQCVLRLRSPKGVARTFAHIRKIDRRHGLQVVRFAMPSDAGHPLPGRSWEPRLKIERESRDEPDGESEICGFSGPALGPRCSCFNS